MMRREIFHSSFRRGGGWKVTEGGEILSFHETQVEAEKEAIRRSRAAERSGCLAQAVLHRKDGRIREERTYGKDPERSPG